MAASGPCLSPWQCKNRNPKGYKPAVSCRSGDEAEVDILSGAGALLGRNKQLAAGLIETTRLKDANQQEPSKSVVQSVEFHPAGQLLLTAGFDKRLRLFQVPSQLRNHVRVDWETALLTLCLDQDVCYQTESCLGGHVCTGYALHTLLAKAVSAVHRRCTVCFSTAVSVCGQGFGQLLRACAALLW